MTMTVVEWMPLFIKPEIVSILLESIRFVQKERGLLIYAYVITENHLHLVVFAPHLGKTIKEFKSFTARTIIDFLKDKKSTPLLRELKQAKLQHKKESDYQLWQEGSHPQEIMSEKMLLQKINYIHNNPVKRGYIDKPSCWRYSSARDYEGKKGLLEVHTEWGGGL